jgi:surface carbohydrate biosynthesis protein (TIGR04326 family)
MIKITIIDSAGLDVIDNSYHIYWSDFLKDNESNALSIPTYIEEHSLEIRESYLKFVYEFGNTVIGRKSIIDHLGITSNFSLWWTTLVAQKCNYLKSPQIDNIIKLLSFQRWCKNKEIGHIQLNTRNHDLIKSFEKFCTENNIKFTFLTPAGEKIKIEHSRSADKEKKLSTRVYRIMPNFFQALAWFIFYLAEHWNLKGVNLDKWKDTSNSITMMSFLVNLDEKQLKIGKHSSAYWGPVPELLHRNNQKINWIHIYEKNSHVPNTHEASSKIIEFTNSSKDIHVLLETFLSFKILLRTLRDWMKVIKVGLSLRNTFDDSIGNNSLLPLLKKDWNASIFGQEALKNIINFHLLNSALNYLPKQRLGLLLTEYQPQEISFMHCFKKNHHQNLVACAHSTLRFWDLRYHFDKNIFSDNSKYIMPMPDKLTVNGMSMHKSLSDSNFPAEKMFHVEAQRYLYLENLSIDQNVKYDPLNNLPLKLLVMGDYSMANNIQLLECLQNALLIDNFEIDITFKHHPACPIEPQDFPDINFNQTAESMKELLPMFNIVFTSNPTSASIDAIFSGKPVISIVDPKKLNLSPLRNQPGAFFACSPEELCFILKNCNSLLNDDFHNIKSTFFNLDSSLPLWDKLIKSFV